MHIPAAALLASTLLLSGCAHIMQKPLVEGPTTATPLPMAPAATGGSLFQAGQAMNYGYQPMFEDRRPRNVGDTLTILLQENVSASKSSSASANRNGSAGMGLIAVPTKLNGWLGDGKADFEAEGKNDFAGKGGAAARNTFTGTITVTVKSCCRTATSAWWARSRSPSTGAPNLSVFLA